jgi:hypothetical protein
VCVVYCAHSQSTLRAVAHRHGVCTQVSVPCCFVLAFLVNGVRSAAAVNDMETVDVLRSAHPAGIPLHGSPGIPLPTLVFLVHSEVLISRLCGECLGVRGWLGVVWCRSPLLTIVNLVDENKKQNKKTYQVRK